ncbi:hypothetical protein ElyMa_006275500, partial [Elysia marginata]
MLPGYVGRSLHLCGQADHNDKLTNSKLIHVNIPLEVSDNREEDVGPGSYDVKDNGVIKPAKSFGLKINRP